MLFCDVVISLTIEPRCHLLPDGSVPDPGVEVALGCSIRSVLQIPSIVRQAES